MVNLKNNRLLWIVVAVAAAYWIFTPFVPNPYLSSTLSFALLCSAIMTFYQYGPPSYRILFKGERHNEEGDGQGSHLAVLAVFMFALGSAVTGIYTLTWNIHGQPSSWIGSAPSQFGKSCHIAAFCLMQISPQITPDGLQIRARWWVVAIISTILVLIGFYFGLQVGDAESSQLYWFDMTDASLSAIADLGSGFAAPPG